MYGFVERSLIYNFPSPAINHVDDDDDDDDMDYDNDDVFINVIELRLQRS